MGHLIVLLDSGNTGNHQLSFACQEPLFVCKAVFYKLVSNSGISMGVPFHAAFSRYSDGGHLIVLLDSTITRGKLFNLH